MSSTSSTPSFTSTQPDITKLIFVALVEHGIPKFSSEPVPHATRKAAIDEVERLAKAHPGQQFAAFRMDSMLVSTPKERIYTGAELLKDAPEGTYIRSTASSHTRFLVMENNGNRVALFISRSDHVSPLNGMYWNHDTFKRVSGRASLTVNTPN